MDKIKFGTDGWRGLIAKDFTFANVRRVTEAIAQYIHEEGDASKGFVVGYDTRFLSEDFAKCASEVVASAGIPVMLADRATPTPAVSYAVVARQAAGAIMITASHNPWRWNGLKIKAPCGGSAAPSVIRKVEVHLRRLDRAGTRARKRRPASVEVLNLVGPYRERIKTFVHLDKIRSSGRRFVIDPMYGAGSGCLAGIFGEAGIPYREIHAEQNPLFPGMNPEPILPNVEQLRHAVLEGGYDAGLATDGDADRLGAVDRSGTFIDSHKIFCILLKYLAEDRGLRGEVVKTVSTTEMVTKLARKYGFPLHVTPIGFKYICELMLTRDILIGGEESGGIGIRGHLPERDGILNSLLLAEVMALRGRTLGELVQELTEEFGPHCYGRHDLEIDKKVAQRIVRLVGQNKLKRVAGLKVTSVDCLDGAKMRFGDSAWLLVRASGTENLLRLYAEAPSEAQVKALLAEIETFARKHL